MPLVNVSATSRSRAPRSHKGCVITTHVGQDGLIDAVVVVVVVVVVVACCCRCEFNFSLVIHCS